MGVVRRPWGFDGSIAVSQYSDDPDRLGPGQDVVIDGTRYSIESSRSSGRSTVLKLSLVDGEEQAARLRGKTIEMATSDLPVPPPGVYYHYQIIGARVVTVDGEDLGTVAEILQTGSNDVYVVRAERPADQGPGKAAARRRGQNARAEILVPALKDVIVGVDVEKRLIEVDLPEGLR